MALVTTIQTTPQILTLTLNDPDRLNAMSEEMAKEFAATVDQIANGATHPRAIILTGAGKAFSAGGDLAMLERKQQQLGERNRVLMLQFYDSFLRLLKLEVPLVAAINGAAIGAGLCLASACDIRIASTAAKLGFTFAKIGLHPGMGATYFLPRVVGHAVASELLLTGRVIEADEALRIRLVSKVVAADQVMHDAQIIAQEISDCGPEAVRQLLGSLRMGPVNMQQALEREAACQAVNYASPEFREGLSATMEKRRASF